MTKNNKKKKSGKKLLLILAGIVLAVLVFCLLTLKPGTAAALPEDVIAAEQTMPGSVNPEGKGQPDIVLKDGLHVSAVNSYTGPYWEDGSDEQVSDILSMTVTNITEEPIQYAEITLDQGGETAKFTVSALPAGGTALLLEQNRMAYSTGVDYAQAAMECVNLAGFERKLSLREDLLQLQLLDGAMNIINISENDIPGTVILCYKNVSDGIYQGGIAYRIRLENGMKAGEIRQIMASHIHQPGTELIFVEIVG